MLDENTEKNFGKNSNPAAKENNPNLNNLKRSLKANRA